MSLQVGQRLYYVPSQGRITPSFVTVAKVGRKWATLDSGRRINLETLRADGGGYSSPGSCWESKQAYEAEVALRDAWSGFKRRMDREYTKPAHLTLADIEEISKRIFP